MPVLECSVEFGDFVDMCFGELIALIAETPFHLLEMPRCVDQLHLAATTLGLAVGDQPQISVNTSVVEQLVRQRDDRVEPVVFDDPTADIAFAGAGVTGEKR